MLPASTTRASAATPPATSLSRRGVNRQARARSAPLPSVGRTSQNAKRVSEARSQRAGRNSTSVHSSATRLFLLASPVATSRCSRSWGSIGWGTGVCATIVSGAEIAGSPRVPLRVRVLTGSVARTRSWLKQPEITVDPAPRASPQRMWHEPSLTVWAYCEQVGALEIHDLVGFRVVERAGALPHDATPSLSAGRPGHWYAGRITRRVCALHRGHNRAAWVMEI
jgi:hypothetical protein